MSDRFPHECTGLVGLAGPAGIGKGRVSDLLYLRHGFRTYSIETNIREAVLAMDPMLNSELSLAQLVDQVDWDAAKTHRVHGPEVNRLLEVMGTEVGRVFFGEGVWTGLVAADIEAGGGFSTGRPVVVDDIHSDDEARWVRSLGGQVWQVVNPTAGGPRNRHRTEAPISSDLVDHVLIFDGDVAEVTKQIDRILTPAATAAPTPKEVAAA